MFRPLPSRNTAPGDPVLRSVAAAAGAIIVAALLAAALFWRALSGAGGLHGVEAVGAALTPEDGVLVVDGLRRGGRAERAGLHVGDVLRSVDGVPVATVSAADHVLGIGALDLGVRRGDRVLTLHLPPQEGRPLG